MRTLWRYRRVSIPALLATVLLLVSGLLPPLLAFVAIMASFGLFLDAGLASMPTTGGLGQHRQ